MGFHQGLFTRASSYKMSISPDSPSTDITFLHLDGQGTHTSEIVRGKWNAIHTDYPSISAHGDRATVAVTHDTFARTRKMEQTLAQVQSSLEAMSGTATAKINDELKDSSLAADRVRALEKELTDEADRVRASLKDAMELTDEKELKTTQALVRELTAEVKGMREDMKRISSDVAEIKNKPAAGCVL